MTGAYSHSIKIGDDGKVKVLPRKQSNVRSEITVTCDGLPLLLAIDVTVIFVQNVGQKLKV